MKAKFKRLLILKIHCPNTETCQIQIKKKKNYRNFVFNIFVVFSCVGYIENYILRWYWGSLESSFSSIFFFISFVMNNWINFKRSNFSFQDNMKRENEDNNFQDQQEQQLMQSDENPPDQCTDQEDSRDGTNDTKNFNLQNNQDNGNGGPNPPKRLRRNDDEEIRLLIPSKVSPIDLKQEKLSYFFSFFCCFDPY